MDLQEAFDAGFEAVKAYVDGALGELVQRLAVLEAKEFLDAEAVQGIAGAAVTKAVAELPQPDTAPYQPTDEQIKALVRGVVEEALSKAVASIPVPKDGKSVTIDDVAPLVERAVNEAVSKIPVPADGVGLASAVQDRKGHLILTMTDGRTCDVGKVAGEDADMAALKAEVVRMVEAIPTPKDGSDGLGFDDLTAEFDGERGITLRMVRGERVKEFAFSLPVVIDRGVFKEGGSYVKGDGCTFGGSFWIAQKDTDEKPGTGDGWRLAVKKGRDGKDGVVRDMTPKPVKVS